MKKNYLKLSSLILGALSLLPSCKTFPINFKSIKSQSYAQQINDIDKTLTKHNHPRKVDLEILIDKEFMNKHKEFWWNNFLEEFQFVDNRFKREFGIDFDVDSVKYLELSKDCPNDLSFILTYLRVKFKPGQYDAFALMSGKEFGNKMGICWCLGNHLIATSDKEFPLKRVLQHELSHLYDAVDIKGPKSIMSGYVKHFSYNWCNVNAHVIQLNKHRTWDEGSWYFNLVREIVNDFPKQDKDDVAKLFCYQFIDTFYPEAVPLAKKLLQKHPKRVFIQDCYEFLLEKQTKQK